MKLFKNKVGRPLGKENKIKKIKRNIIIVLYMILFIFIIFLLKVNFNKLNGNVTTEYLYVKGDSILRSAPKKTPLSTISTIKGTKVIHNENKDTKNYYYVTIDPNLEENKGFYLKEFSGYILKSRLTKNKVLHNSNRNLHVRDKTYVIRNAMLLYKYNNKNGSKFSFGYSFDGDKRKTGYDFIVNNKKRNGKYYFDCSSFVSTVYKATFDLNFEIQNGESVYKTYNFYDEVKGHKIGDETKHFYIVDMVTKNTSRKKLKTYYLQSGDLILGMNKYSVRASGNTNHVMLYIGDGKIIHSSGKTSEKIRYSNLTNNYVTVGSKYNYSQKIYILRIKENINKKLNKLEINDSRNGFNIYNIK